MPGRRTFINQIAFAAGAVFFRPLNMFAGTGADLSSTGVKKTLTLFHAAGLDGQWAPLEQPHVLHGLGGLVNLQKQMDVIRKQSSSPLFIQSGNIISHQCSKDECSRFYRALSAVEFDVVVPGKHDLAQGKEVFSNLAHENNLPVNLFHQSQAGSGSHLPSTIVVKNANRIGIIHVDARSIHATEALSKTAGLLKAKKCLLVVCVAEGNAKTCAALAAMSESVDVMLASEEVMSLNTTRILHNKKGQEVVLSFAGSKGALMNRMDFTFNGQGEKINVTSSAVFTGAEDHRSASILKQCALFNV